MGFDLIVLVVGSGVLVIVTIDGLRRLYHVLFRPCGLVSQWLLPDKCLGGCPPGAACGPTPPPGGVRPYGPWGMFGTQDAACACAVPAPPAAAAPPTTDQGNPITLSNPAKPFGPERPTERSQEEKDRDAEFGRVPVRREEKGCNCIGFTFGQGNWELDTTEVPTILNDNYTRVPAGRGQVCNIIVWRLPDGSIDHAGLVVEVDANGQPKTVRSKATISDFVKDHAPDARPYGPDYEVYERNSTDGLDAATRDEIRRLRDAYDRIADKSSPAARDAAERLCKKKNGLRGSGD